MTSTAHRRYEWTLHKNILILEMGGEVMRECTDSSAKKGKQP